MAHDALTGYWNPEADNLPVPSAPKDPDSLDYLSGFRRAQVLFTGLIARLRVTPGPEEGSATLTLDGTPICTVTRPGPEVFRQQIVWLRNYADLRPDRVPEIVLQTEDLLSFFGSAAFLNGSRRSKTLELLSLVQAVAVALEMRVKHLCWAARPIDYAPEVQPIIQTPDHSSFPSGHATEAYALATVLERLQGGRSAAEGIAARSMRYRIAHRIAVNRTVAGVHFPVDSAAGAVLGCIVAEALHSLATGGAAPVLDYGAGGAELAAGQDFLQQWLRESFAPEAAPGASERDALFARFWQAAADEWN